MSVVPFLLLLNMCFRVICPPKDDPEGCKPLMETSKSCATTFTIAILLVCECLFRMKN